MPDVTTTGFVKAGRVQMRNRKSVMAQLSRMKDCELVIAFTPLKAARSGQQNRWYWGVIVELIAEHTGYTPDEIHEILKAKFIPKRLAVADGNGAIVDEFVIGGSSAKLDKVAFGEYCEAIRRWAAEDLGVVIPDPESGSLWTGAKPQKQSSEARA